LSDSENKIELFFKENGNKIALFAAVFVFICYAAFVVVSYLYYSYQYTSKSVFYAIAFVFLSTGSLNLILRSRMKSFILFQTLLCLIFLFAELLFAAAPGIFPKAIVDYVTSKKNVKEMVEFLDESPYAKFLPNTQITSRGKIVKGTDFTFTWMTDKQGFKNFKHIYDEQIEAVAIGDSFTESMGCKIKDTWPNVMSEKYGINTLNLGVQGYSPQQMIGSLEKYGMKFKPKVIIFAYTGGTYVRAEVFANEHSGEKKITGGIRSVANRTEIKKVPLTSFTFLLLKISSKSIKTKLYVMKEKKRIEKLSQASPLNRYIPEMQGSNHNEPLDKKNKGWMLTVKSVLKAKEMADAIGSKLLVVHFPHRPYIYYESVYGKKPSGHMLEQMEIEELSKLAEEENFSFLPLDDFYLDYMKKLSKDGFSDITKLPYFKKDGHMSPVGTHMAAGIIAKFIKKEMSK